MALPAALLTFFAAFAVGIPGFLSYAQSMGSGVGDLVLESSHAVNEGRLPSDAPAIAWYSMMLALPAFAFFTPVGILATYLFGSGVFRVAAWAAGEPRGDPVLGLADRVVRRHLGERRDSVARKSRENLEGPERPDLLVRGSDLGAPEAVYAVVASRLKPGWDPGVFVLTETGRFRIGPRQDRRYRDGLRAVYPLLEVPAAEATRRWVTFALPPLRQWDALQQRERPLIESDPGKSRSEGVGSGSEVEESQGVPRPPR
jgi:hypothetical protein